MVEFFLEFVVWLFCVLGMWWYGVLVGWCCCVLVGGIWVVVGCSVGSVGLCELLWYVYVVVVLWVVGVGWWCGVCDEFVVGVGGEYGVVGCDGVVWCVVGVFWFDGCIVGVLVVVMCVCGDLLLLELLVDVVVLVWMWYVGVCLWCVFWVDGVCIWWVWVYVVCV